MKKIFFKDVCPTYIYSHPKGYEIKTENGNIPSNALTGKRIPKEDKASVRNHLKGLKVLFNRAKEQRVFDDVLGHFKSFESKYNAILKAFKDEDIEAIGMGQTYYLTAYVNGTFGGYINK